MDDDRVIPRWANALFTAGVVVVFGFAGRYAWMNETRKSDRKRMEREEREERARVAIEAGALRDHRQRNFAVSDEVDPFEGMSPEEIERLSAASDAEAGGRVDDKLREEMSGIEEQVVSSNSALFTRQNECTSTPPRSGMRVVSLS